MTRPTGGETLCGHLSALGATTVFGVPGTQNIPLFEALRTSGLRTVLSASEAGASFMANGFYRASGGPGVFTTIPGPGFTGALTGLAEARHDSAAVVLLVATPARTPGRPFQLQDIDSQAIVGPITKGSFRIERADAFSDTLREAWSTSLTGEPGPVLVEVASEFLAEPATGSSPDPFLQPARLGPDPDLLSEARRRLLEGERVLLFLGQGAAGESSAVIRLLESLGACAVSNSSGRGTVPESHPLSVCGDFSGWGVGLVNDLVKQADLILVLGCKFSHNGTSGFQLHIPPEKLIRVDTSEEVLSANYPASILIQADVGSFLESLSVEGRAPDEGASGWDFHELESWKKRFSEKRRASLSGFPRPAGGGDSALDAFFKSLRDGLPDDAILVTDSGLHQMAVRRSFEVRGPRGLILPSDFQSMGFGIPAAIGASLAAPERKVVAVVGDGGMAMSGLELTTAVREGLDLTVIVFNDGHLGQIRHQQIRDSGFPFATELGKMEFGLFAQAIGISYLALDDKNLGDIEEALHLPGVTLVDLFLADSPDTSRARRRGLVKAGARKALGPSGIRFLKRLLGR